MSQLYAWKQVAHYFDNQVIFSSSSILGNKKINTSCSLIHQVSHSE